MSNATEQSAPKQPAPWHDIVLATLKSNRVKLVVYVPDKVFTPLIKAIHADPCFITFAATREEEAVGIVTGAWMGGMRGALLMQTSGLRHHPERARVAGRAVARFPALIFVSERGTLGEFNLGQALVCRTMRPVLDSLGIETPHHHPAGRTRIHRRPLDQAGGGHAGAGHLHPVAAADRRQSLRGVECHDHDTDRCCRRTNAKVMNRFDLTKRLVAQLKRRRGGHRRHRQRQFRPLGERPAAAEFLHARQHGSGDPDRARRRHRAAAAPRHRARGRRLAADAARLPRDRGERASRRTSPS